MFAEAAQITVAKGASEAVDSMAAAFNSHERAIILEVVPRGVSRGVQSTPINSKQ